MVRFHPKNSWGRTMNLKYSFKLDWWDFSSNYRVFVTNSQDKFVRIIIILMGVLRRTLLFLSRCNNQHQQPSSTPTTQALFVTQGNQSTRHCVEDTTRPRSNHKTNFFYPRAKNILLWQGHGNDPSLWTMNDINCFLEFFFTEKSEKGRFDIKSCWCPDLGCSHAFLAIDSCWWRIRILQRKECSRWFRNFRRVLKLFS